VRGVLAAAALALGGCALLGPREKPDPVLERGHATADRLCGSCHGVEPGRGSPRARAPAFWSLEMRHTAGLEGRLAELTRQGHYGMPPAPLQPQQVQDLLAYIESLGR